MAQDEKDPESLASLGGKARAASMTPSQRSEAARQAALSRWVDVGIYPRETHAGKLKFGNVEIECSVLNNGIRVLSTVGITRAFGGKTTGKGKSGPREMPAFLSAERLKPFLNSDLTARVTTPVRYAMKRGGRANGYEATLLPELCKLFIDARRQKRLLPTQLKYAEAAETILEGLATVGIIALVDEATGYQSDRAKDELMKILEAYINKALLPWTRRFPPDFFREICRLYGWPTRDRGNGKHQWPRQMGLLVKRLIYEPLPEGVLDELERKNPTLPAGYRRYKHHQFLTPDIGNPHLGNQVASVMSLMRVSDTKAEFLRLFERAFPKRETNVLVVSAQLKLDLPDY